MLRSWNRYGHRVRRPLIRCSRRLLTKLTLCVGLLFTLGVGAQEFRTIDGSGNNLANPEWGSAGAVLLRISSADYGDGASTPAGADRPSAREVSNGICAEGVGSVGDPRMSNLFWLWGQFLDHDLSLTPPDGGVDAEFDIEVPMGDPWFDPMASGTVTIPFNRSHSVDILGVREHENEITAFIDASNVYGSDETRADALRANDGSGKLLVSENDYLPYNDGGLPNDSPTPLEDFFLAGDVRANENIGLTSLHNLFVREHNRLCDLFADDDPGLTGDELYDLARRWVGALMQVITYQEFLPHLLGDTAIPAYTGYDDLVNPGIATEFSTVAYRFGHTMLPGAMVRLSERGAHMGPSLELRDVFFSPDTYVDSGGIGPVLSGALSTPARKLDHKISDDIRNFLFGPPGSGGLDLASLNLQRGRDHGIPDLNSLRVAYGLTAHASFTDVNDDTEVSDALADIYDTVDDIDPWIGFLSETPVTGALIGETGFEILVDQFTRLRDGDRFWYANDAFTEDEIEDLEATTLADVILRNTTRSALASDAFVVSNFVRGDVNQDDLIDIADVISTATWLFTAEGEVTCLAAVDVNNDNWVDVGDALNLANYLFQGGPAPGAPFDTCGPPPATDQLGCAASPTCE